MSRVAKNPVIIPHEVAVKTTGQHISVKGNKGQLSYDVHHLITVLHEKDQLQVVIPPVFAASRSQIARRDTTKALAGTTRAILNNMIIGVSQGFVKKLVLVGVGYRAKLEGNNLVLALGFSHPVNYQLPANITAKVPSQTEIELESADKQLVGQVAAEIRYLRPPEPYKGKGVRYANEVVELKETKKK